MAAQHPANTPDGRLVENILHFVRALRKAGIRVGTAQVGEAIRAVEAAGFTRRDDFYHVLRATLINRPEHLDVFHQIFAMFWRDPDFLEHMIHLLSPSLKRETETEKRKQNAERRATEALTDRSPAQKTPDRDELEVEATFSWSANETLRSMDFEQMSNAEIAEAERALRTLHLPVRPVLTRRTTLSANGRRPDLHATLRTALRRGGEVSQLAMRAPRTRPPNLVAFCDISGSMSVYSRMLMRFLHALAWSPDGNWGQISAFTFGTRLTNVTRALRLKDPDAALAAAGQDARDWEGGTRIGPAIEQFNKTWSRRVLGQGAVVLLITDGLERGETTLLSEQIERLHLSCRQLIWLNPLLRWDGFAPKAAGVRTILPHVDGFYACHSLDSLASLTDALASPPARWRSEVVRSGASDLSRNWSETVAST